MSRWACEGRKGPGSYDLEGMDLRGEVGFVVAPGQPRRNAPPRFKAPEGIGAHDLSALRPDSHSVFGRWHPEREGRAVPGRRRHRNIAVVRLGNLADQREPDTVGLAPGPAGVFTPHARIG